MLYWVIIIVSIVLSAIENGETDQDSHHSAKEEVEIGSRNISHPKEIPTDEKETHNGNGNRNEIGPFHDV